MSQELPIDALRPQISSLLEEGPLVISSPTGSGKSTQVPRWCPGPVLVVEPRRVACRALACRVADLENSPLGDAVGYQVRDERRARASTRILFATPGTVLRFAERWPSFATIVLDEFHERSLEVDLLLALLLERQRRLPKSFRLVVMSATLEGDRLASHLGGRHLHAEGRMFPVHIEYQEDEGVLLPDARNLEDRVAQALFSSPREAGDVLVFLPGKGEIGRCARRLANRSDLQILELHGGLSLEEQSRIFGSSSRRKVVLATNVAETSLTVPGIGLVIDSGLVRQTRYHRDRGFLTLVPIAKDSADQRSGRAGRTGPGHCIRLWSPAAQLEDRTPPEIHRESLVPLLLAASACGASTDRLPFFDPPRTHSLETAEKELLLLGALDEKKRITPRGSRLFGLPLEVNFSRWLVEAEGRRVLDDMIDLVACLAPNRPLLTGLPAEEDATPEELGLGCDARHLIRALRGAPDMRPHVRRAALEEARWLRRRLRQAFGLPSEGPKGHTFDRKTMALTLLAADPRTAHVVRSRGRRQGWANGGTEIELGRESAVNQLENVEALVVLSTRALGLGRRDTRILIDRAMPVPIPWLVEAGLGRDRLGSTSLRNGRVVCQIERVHARRVLTTREEVPEGALARRALTELFLAGQLFPESLETAQDRLRLLQLAWRLAKQGGTSWLDPAALGIEEEPPTALDVWILHRLTELGVESGDDVELLSPEDLLPIELPAHLRLEIDRRFPSQLKLPGASYVLDYALEKRRVILRQTTGRKMVIPPVSYLPPFEGLSVLLLHKGVERKLR